MITVMDHVIGIGLAGYRSFGHSVAQYVGPLAKVNLIAGQNNAGKSNLLRAVEQMFQQRSRRTAEPSPLDAPAGDLMADKKPRLSIALNGASLRKRLDARQVTGGLRTQIEVTFTSMLRVEGAGDLMWLVFESDSGRLVPSPEWVADVMPGDRRDWAAAMQQASSQLSNQSGGGHGEDLKRVIGRLGIIDGLPKVKTIPAFRQIQAAEAATETFSGLGLISQIAKLESPSAADHDNRARFEAIQDFVRNVVDDPDLTITVPYDRDTINVRLGRGAVLPLEHMGTGIHQVVILAAAATVLNDTLVCVEEPEIHLHPLLQRKLVRYLQQETTNQYLIATHSAHMLDADVASLFHITRGSNGASQVRAALTPGDRAQICADLGYRASDLVQANAIIWVEGPSDRVYLRHWIQLIDPDLVEGIHFSIMFYGGRLLNHLTANDPDIEDFISLRRLNRHVAILIDSDKTSRQKPINATKKRVSGELAADGVAWITKGYTIENYVPQPLLEQAIQAAHPSGRLVGMTQYENPLARPSMDGIAKPDKLAIARKATELWSPGTDWPYDLRACVTQLVSFIHTANGSAR